MMMRLDDTEVEVTVGSLPGSISVDLAARAVSAGSVPPDEHVCGSLPWLWAERDAWVFDNSSLQLSRLHLDIPRGSRPEPWKNILPAISRSGTVGLRLPTELNFGVESMDKLFADPARRALAAVRLEVGGPLAWISLAADLHVLLGENDRLVGWAVTEVPEHLGDRCGVDPDTLFGACVGFLDVAAQIDVASIEAGRARNDLLALLAKAPCDPLRTAVTSVISLL